jgi:hypothetical protein
MSEMKNPYKYLGPLDPVSDKDICAPRKENVLDVIDSIGRGDYRMILGPRQIGKTTLLHQVQNEFDLPNFVHFNFEIAPKKENNFYQWLVDQFLKAIPHKKSKFSTITSNDPDMAFIDFLEHFRAREAGKIILLFDEIDRIRFLRNFLHLLRNVLHQRQWRKDLQRYIVVTTGSMNLLSITSTPNSPYNIAQPLFLEDLSKEESEKIIDKPLTDLEIQIEPEAKKDLLSQTSGHPQLLQHTCFLLVKNVKDPKIPITQMDVKKAIKSLFLDNSSLNTLKRDLRENSTLKGIVTDILAGKEKKYHPYKNLALLGAGAFKEDVETSLCKIRNPVYKEFINDILEHQVEETAWSSKEEPKEEEEKQEAKEPISKSTTQLQAESSPGKRKKSPFRLRLRHVFYLVGMTGIILFVVSVLEQNPGMMTAAGFVSALALGVLTVILKD